MADATLSASRRGWGIGRVTAITEMSSGGRVWATLFETAVPLYLTVMLWRGLYSDTGPVAGVTLDQAVTYAVVGALLTYLRVGNRGWVRDAPSQHIRLGTIVYWFLWPIRPATYHAVRAAGDLGYVLAWAVPAYLICLTAGAISTPVSGIAAVATAVSLLLGQVIVYLIALLLDLLCFWTVVNDQIIRMVAFVQALLSGGFAPLWFFPDWFQLLSRALPFQSVINIPMSIYVGRAQGNGIPWALAEQLVWCALLGMAARVLWAKAARRVDVLGG